MYSVSLDPCKATFNTKDALRTTRIYIVVIDDSVGWTLSAEGHIRFEVRIDFVLLDMSCCAFNQKDALTEVSKHVILDDSNRGTFSSLDASQSVRRNWWILLNLGKVIGASTYYGIILIFLNIVKLDCRIAANEILGNRDDSIFYVLSDAIHYNERVGG
jgi:hypothetical protein